LYAARAIDAVASNSTTVLLDELVARGAVVRRNLLYLRNLLAMLERRGMIARDGQGWRRTGAAEAPEASWRVALAAHPNRLASLELIARSGDRIPAFLAAPGDGDAYSPWSRDPDLVEQLVESDPLFGPRNRAAAGVVTRLLRALPPSDPIRVLEIGGGPAGLAATILPLLPADRATYDYAVADEDGVARAGANFADHPNFRARLLRLDRELESADLEAFDLVLIGNALFGVAELKPGLGAVARLTKPGGIVASVGGVPDDLATFMFGMSSRWWDFTDIDSRTDGPLVAPETWVGALRDAGFAEVETADESRLVLARKRSAPRFTEINDREPSYWLIVAPPASDHAAALNDRLDVHGHRVVALE
ncbi:MAG: class I SAM-dependent methyltransferase, partial [Stellaceae bacterium]